MVVRLRKFWWTALALMVFVLFGSTLRADISIYPEFLPGLGPSVAGPTHLWADKVFGDADAFLSFVGWWPDATTPYSFVYDGKSSQSLLPSWKRTSRKHVTPDGTHYVTTWLDAKTGLKVVATATAFVDFPAVDWVLRFENTGKHDTPILENAQALDIALETFAKDDDVILDQIRGDDCSPQSFLPIERP